MIRIYNSVLQGGTEIADDSNQIWQSEAQRTGEILSEILVVRLRFDFGASSKREKLELAGKTRQSQRRILRVFLLCNVFAAIRKLLEFLLWKNAKGLT